MMFNTWIVITVISYFVHTSAHLNLYLSKIESERILGLGTQVYYVRNGVINEYALRFMVTVPANISHLFFTWESLLKRPMSYLAQIEYNNGEAMALPTLNISTKGVVPTHPTTFSMSLPCSGAADAQVHVNLHLNVSTSSKNKRNVTQLTIRRKKICLRGVFNPAGIRLPRNESIQHRPKWAEPPSGMLYVAMGAACAGTVLILTVMSLIYLRIKKTRDQSLNCHYYSSSGFLGAGDSSTVEGMRGVKPLAPSLRSNSYVTIASLRKFPLPKSSPTHGLLSSDKLNGMGYGGSVHYASSPLSQLYSQVYTENGSSAQSILNSRLSQSSWRTPGSVKSYLSWKDPRENDPSERIRQLTVDRWRVVVGETLQEGTFGRVHQGLCHDPYTQKALSVVVKTVSAQASTVQTHLLLLEGLVLAGLQHQNLLPVLGVCTQDPKTPLLLYPYQGSTNLKLMLLGKTESGVKKEGSRLLTRDAVHVAIDVCHGLIYLHKQKILHKDVAARNCMIDKDLQTRITDTALSRDLFPEDYHCLGDNENRPIKWMSLEAITHKQFSPSTDMWMFGVLIWELMTSAQQPYSEIDPFEMAAYLRDGYRLSQPHNCPDDLFSVMAMCWAPYPEERPHFKNTLNCLKELHTTLSSYV